MVVVLFALAAQAPLTLDDAIARALDAHEDTRMAKLVVDKVEAQRAEAVAQLFGTVRLDGTYRRRANEARPNGSALALKNAIQGVARADVTLFDATAIPKIGAAGDRLEAAQHENEAARRNLAYEVGSAFLEVLAAERFRDAAARRATFADKTVRDVRARFDAGLAARNVLNRSKLELATARLEATRAHNAVRQLRLALGFLVARDVDEPLEEPEVKPPASSGDLLAMAIESRPDFAALRAAVEAARSESREPWLRLVPTLAVSGEVTATNETGFANQVFNWNVAATLSWLVWDGGVRYAVAAERAADLEAAHLALAQRVRRVALEIEQAASDLKTAAAAVEQAEAQKAIATENAEEVRARFAQGLATALEIADAAASEFEAAQSLARERFRASAAALRLSNAVGAWPSSSR